MSHDYRMEVRPQAGYLHIVVTGTNSKENVLGYLAEVRDACAAHNCFRVLIEERLEGPRINLLDVFAIALAGVEMSGGMNQTVAYVDVNARGTSMNFAETVARDRGLPITVFSNVAEAERWMNDIVSKKTFRGP
jgi:hypothetical protein